MKSAFHTLAFATPSISTELPWRAATVGISLVDITR
jgi:hypothetical protein